MKVCFNLNRHVLDLCFSKETLTRIGKLVDLDTEVPARGQLTEEWLQTHAAGCDAIIAGWEGLPIDAAVLAAAPELRIVFFAAGSIKWLETPAMWKRGVRVTSAAHVNAVSVAEYALGIILMCFRDVFAQQARFKAQGRQGWYAQGHLLSYYGSTVGIIGMGNVGKHLLKLLGNFQMRTLVHSFYPFEAEAAAAGAETASIDEVMARADAVVLLAPNIPENKRMIDARRLALMRDNTFFINPGRGDLVDESALIAELETGRITACLDVTSPEPPTDGSPFYSLPNCILTPHIAGSRESECHRLGDQVLVELERYLAGKPLDNEITEELARVIG